MRPGDAPSTVDLGYALIGVANCGGYASVFASDTLASSASTAGSTAPTGSRDRLNPASMLLLLNTFIPLLLSRKRIEDAKPTTRGVEALILSTGCTPPVRTYGPTISIGRADVAKVSHASSLANLHMSQGKRNTMRHRKPLVGVNHAAGWSMDHPTSGGSTSRSSINRLSNCARPETPALR